MNEQAINEQYEVIAGMLRQRRLREAQAQLEAFLHECNNWELRTRLEQARTSYNYMLQYMQQGVDDPERQRLYGRLLAETWEVADQARLQRLDEVSGSYYHTMRKSRDKAASGPETASLRQTLEAFPDDMALCRLMPDDRPALERALSRHEEAQKRLFLRVWTDSAWDVREAGEAQECLHSELLPLPDLCLLVSAVTLSLTACFDIRKAAFLMDAASDRRVQVSQRALTGFALVLLLHPGRLSLYPEQAARLQLMADEEGLGDALQRIGLQLLYSQETEKIDRKMREEIIPEVMKNVNILRHMKLGFEERMDENDMNPDWEEAFNRSGLGDRIREMSEMQADGADIYLSSFSQLKRYPFFQELHNWFYPFDTLHSSVVRLFGLQLADDDHGMLSIVLRSGFFCDSDKYSFCLTCAQMPPAQREMMMSQLTAQNLEELSEADRLKSMQQYAARPEVVSNLYIHDLFRFFRLHPRRAEFRNPFDGRMELHRVPELQPFLSRPDRLKAVADFLFRKEHHAEALDIYLGLARSGEADADLFQKTGYCLQKEKRYREAIEAYRKADVLKPDHIWTIRHLATCYRQLHELPAALDHYRRAEAIQPDNLNLLFIIGSCLAEQEQYDEALRYFFKLDYLAGDHVKAWRAIGWCSFVCGKHEQAMRYYEKVLALDPTATDYLNCGHVAWAQGDVARASRCYARSTALCESRQVFLDMFWKDKPVLLAQGIREEDIPLVLDMSC